MLFKSEFTGIIWPNVLLLQITTAQTSGLYSQVLAAPGLTSKVLVIKYVPIP